MPKFAANLSMLFTEVPFLDRFAAASKAGFKYVEFMSPYEYKQEELLSRITEAGVQRQLGRRRPGHRRRPRA